MNCRQAGRVAIRRLRSSCRGVRAPAKADSGSYPRQERQACGEVPTTSAVILLFLVKPSSARKP
jgi:hypothetical protein